MRTLANCWLVLVYLALIAVVSVALLVGASA